MNNSRIFVFVFGGVYGSPNAYLAFINLTLFRFSYTKVLYSLYYLTILVQNVVTKTVWTVIS